MFKCDFFTRILLTSRHSGHVTQEAQVTGKKIIVIVMKHVQLSLWNTHSGLRCKRTTLDSMEHPQNAF